MEIWRGLNPYYAYLYSWWEISQASRRWIGWGDYDNDGILDPLDARPWGENTKIGVFRSGDWYLDYNFDETVEKSFRLGLNGDIPVVGDFSGDGFSDAGVFRPLTGYWYLDYDKNGGVDKSFHLGLNGDTPMVGKWI